MKWSHSHISCTGCGTQERPHCAGGLCRRCYNRRYQTAWRRTEDGRRLAAESNRRWAVKADNAEVHRRSARISRDRKFGLSLDIPRGYEAIVFAVFGRRCASCGSDRNLVLDHHEPVQRGHSLLHNAVPLCRRCNAKKGDRSPAQFYDGWKLTAIAVLLHEVRVGFEERLLREAPP
jgi:5-methylcytosine-specific restriction endonuclease McrA